MPNPRWLGRSADGRDSGSGLDADRSHFGHYVGPLDHSTTLLRAHGLEVAVAVGFAALLGPSQVGARLVKMTFGRHYHPIWTLIFATALVGGGLGVLLSGLPPIAAVIFYGGGIGIAWIARGTVPLAIFGPRDQAARMGRPAFPSLIAQALSPSLGAVLLDGYGAQATRAVLLTGALAALAAAAWLQRSACSESSPVQKADC